MTRRRGCICWTQRYWRGTGARFRGCSGVQCLSDRGARWSPLGGRTTSMVLPRAASFVPLHSETAVAVPCNSASVSFPFSVVGHGNVASSFFPFLCFFPLLTACRSSSNIEDIWGHTWSNTNMVVPCLVHVHVCPLRNAGTVTDKTIERPQIGADEMRPEN